MFDLLVVCGVTLSAPASAPETGTPEIIFTTFPRAEVFTAKARAEVYTTDSRAEVFCPKGK